ncbi:excinuclease ABC subunit UvrC [bacterium]|nr:excinuclease ABC subunit UvrC [bacterium]
MTIEEKLENLPDQPGIYRFFSKSGKIIYIGKAKNLKNRIRSYFLESNRLEYRIRFLVPQIEDVEWIVTHSEAEALILEDQLIKTHRPKFNIRLKDDKSYPYFKLSVNELYPRLTLVRELKKDGALYFGPYVAAGKARETSRVIKRYFPLRQSSMPLDGKKTYRPCLNYQMKQCLAPCAGLISPEEYGKIVQHVIQLLKGNYQELISSLKTDMEAKSVNLQFEEAADIRDQIQAVTSTLQKQQVVSQLRIDRDIFAIVRSGGFAGVQVLFVRNGMLLSDDFVFIQQAELYDDAEILRSVLSRFYVSGGKVIPREIILPFEYDDATMLEAYCSNRRNSNVKVLFPKKGEKKVLLEMAEKNGEHNIAVEMRSLQADELVLQEVKHYLKLQNLPNRVECFDISNISGVNMVASMVVWEGNHSKKADYRKFRIKTVEGINDYAAMEEVLQRHYKRVQENNLPLPDLILVDGGKGQLAIAERILTEQGVDLTLVDLIGLAKGRSEKKVGMEKEEEDYEYVVKPRLKNIIRLKKNSSTLFFLQRIRDEAHRFAISYYRKLHGKKTIESELELIPGIGPKKRKILLQKFNSLKNIRNAKLNILESITGISGKDAAVIHQFFNSEKPQS